MSEDYELRVTRAALKDLGLKDLAGPDFQVAEHVDRHPMLAAFVSKRSNSPVGQEPTLGVRGEVYNLHAQDPWRGVTWLDEAQKVCWLLAASAHNYNLFVSRYKAGTLAPTTADYADLDVWRTPGGLGDSAEAFLERATGDAAKLREEAFGRPNEEVRGELAGVLDVGLLVEMMVVEEEECCDVYVSLSMPPRPGYQLPDDLVVTCAALLLPEASAGDVDWYLDRFPRSPASQGPGDEVVIRWRKP